MKPNPLISVLTAASMAFSRGEGSSGKNQLDADCPGGRLFTTADNILIDNWNNGEAQVYEREAKSFWLPHQLGLLAIHYYTQGFRLAGNEPIGKWTKVSVAPQITISTRILGQFVHKTFRLPVGKETEACRDSEDNIYIREIDSDLAH